MSEQNNRPNELSDADVIMGKRILYSVAFIGAVLLVALAMPRIMEMF